MPPIPQQQTSRAGLITALVISIIVALGVLVWAIMTNADRTKVEQECNSKLEKYKDIVDEGSLAQGNPDMDHLRNARTDPLLQVPARTALMDVANRLRKLAVKLITGSEGNLSEANTAVDQIKQDLAANDALKGASIPTDSLANTIKALSAKAKADADAVAAAKKEAQQARTDFDEEKKRHQAEIDKRDAAVKAEQEKAAKSAADAAAAIAEKQKQVDEAAKRQNDTEKSLNDAVAKAETEKQTLAAEINKQKAEVDKRQQRLAQYTYNVKNVWIRNVDAVITQVAPDNRCYINLGFGDHVMPGLTFEVYGKNDGIPPIKDGTSMYEMPKGKGSIEIIDVGQNSCLCRIVIVQPGQQIQQGDLCGNLVYDRNVKPVFFVYGDFDMDQNGVATPAEGEVIKSIIQRWGGKVTDKLTLEVDFVIIGKEPQIPPHTKEEYDSNPQIKLKVDDAKAKLAAYNETVRQTGEYHIPIMNQNRFLYYTGYFDTSRK